ncbi:VOC family protein [Herbaspirillum sp. NPDC087042]|uniref:VOC family protein n=1 Tax=Herbaspirillum sp. NPDC087042 TaxID=3364004 RepID=UPI0038078F16
MRIDAAAVDRMDLFGASSMGYVMIESEHLERWRELMQKGLGMHLSDDGSDMLALRVDAHRRRIVIRRGPAEDVVAIGWQLRDTKALEEVRARLCRCAIALERGSHQEAMQRSVGAFWRLVGPKEMAIELFIEADLSTQPLAMLNPGFVTGASGLGHVAITSRRPVQMRSFWEEFFDARYSDTIDERIAGVDLRVEFLRVNERHHSIAIANVRTLPIDPIRTCIQHVSFLTTTLDGLTEALQRCRSLGFDIAHEIGQHPNDREISFYVMTPSGFEIELGYNALTVDEATWKPAQHQGISLWGHRPEKSGWKAILWGNALNFLRGLQSLRKREYCPIEEAGKAENEKN